jgi:endonuclease III
MIKKSSVKIERIAVELKKEYRDFAHHNKKNPLDELFFILCSVKRSEKVYVEAFRSLKQRFPRYELLGFATVKQISRDVFWGGMQNQKAAAAKEIIKRLIWNFGKPTLAPLKKMTDEECERFLTSLPGVGKKVARCVMLYSLDRQVFPVDAHCWRISSRLEWFGKTRDGKPCTARDMDILQEIIPKKLRYTLHVNMVSHGRSICTARNPKCAICVIKRYCGRV